MKIKIIVIAILLLTSQLADATIDQAGQSWTKFVYNGDFSDDHFHYVFETNLRFNFNRNNVFNQNVNLVGLGYSLNKTMTLWFGYNFIPLSSDGDIQYEQRSWEQLSWSLYRDNLFSLDSRTRLEQRWRNEDDGMALRFRERLQFLLPPMSEKVRPITFDEIFFNLNHPDWINDGSVDQNRWLLGLQFQACKRLNIIVGYLNQYQFREPNDQINHVMYLAFEFT